MFPELQDCVLTRHGLLSKAYKFLLQQLFQGVISTKQVVGAFAHWNISHQAQWTAFVLINDPLFRCDCSLGRLRVLERNSEPLRNFDELQIVPPSSPRPQTVIDKTMQGCGAVPDASSARNAST